MNQVIGATPSATLLLLVGISVCVLWCGPTMVDARRLSASPTTAKRTLDAFWEAAEEKERDPASYARIGDTISFHLFFPLRATPRRRTLQEEEEEGHIDDNVDLKSQIQQSVKARKPHPTIVEKVRASIDKRLGVAASTSSSTNQEEQHQRRFCEAMWDRIHCRNVPIVAIEKAFDCHMQRMRARQVTTMPGSDVLGKGDVRPPSSWMIVEGIESEGHFIEKHLAPELFTLDPKNTNQAEEEEEKVDRMKVMIRGLLPYDPTRHPRRHKAKLIEEEDEVKVENDDVHAQHGASGGSSSTVFSVGAANSDDDNEQRAQIHNWPVDNTTSAAVLLDVFMRKQQLFLAGIAPKCVLKENSGGKSVISVAATEKIVNGVPATWCPPGYKVPTSVVFSVVNADSKRNSLTMPLTTKICAAASNASFWRWPFLSNVSTLAKNIVCQVNLTEAFGKTYRLELYERYTMDAVVVFDDGSVADPAPFNNFYDGQFFTNPDKYNSDKGLLQFIPYEAATPQHIQDLYNVPEPQDPKTMRFPRKPMKKNKDVAGGGEPDAPLLAPIAQGVVEFSFTNQPGKGFNTSDLELYMKNLTIPYFNLTNDLVPINTMTNVFQGETSLDMELIMGLNPGVKTYLYNVEYGDNTTCAEYDCAFLLFLSDILNVENEDGSSVTAAQPASVWSISYGGPEFGLQVNLFEQRFAALSASGVTVVASSGDRGAGWSHEYSLVAEFPSSAPSVLGAGGTAIMKADFIGNVRNGFTEIVCSDADLNVITSGGGYSPHYDLPSYQEPFVNEYTKAHRDALEKRGVSGKLINQQFPLERVGTPDVSALAANLMVIMDQQHRLMFGTSASAPILAALVTRINIARLENNMTTMPLFTQFVYAAKTKKSSTIFDVTRGSNCAGEYSSPVNAFMDSYDDLDCFNASAGWDPVTGLGTFNYPELVDFAVKHWSPNVSLAGKNSSKNGDGDFDRPKSAKIAGIVLAALVALAVVVVLLIIFISRKATATRHMDGSSLENHASPLQPRDSSNHDDDNKGGTAETDYNLYNQA